MKIKQKIAILFISLSIIGSATIASTNTSYAAEKCGKADVAILKCDASVDPAEAKDTGLWKILLMVVNIMTGLAALAALGGIVYGAVLYTSAGGSQEQVKKAMGVFTNVAVGIIAFAVMYAALNFLIPGGVF